MNAFGVMVGYGVFVMFERQAQPRLGWVLQSLYMRLNENTNGLLRQHFPKKI